MMTKPMVSPADHADLEQWLGWIRDGTALFEATVAAVRDADLAAPSLLPGWSRAHVIAHVARNADALVNLLTWARTGTETPMYASAEARDAAIQTGAQQPASQLRADLHSAHVRLAEALAGLPVDRWPALVRTASGRTVPATQVAWMRTREVWVHVIDLDADATFADVPLSMLTALLDDAVAAFAARDDVPAVRLRANDADRRWQLGGGDGAVPVVSGPAAGLAAYVLGRPTHEELLTTGGAAAPPQLPAWL